MVTYLLKSLLLLSLLVPLSLCVTVQPSEGYPKSSEQIWPASSNKVAITVKCPSHKVKCSIVLLDKTEQGNVVLRGKDGKMSVFCKDAGDKKTYDGEIRWYPADNRGPCYTGESETLIIEWTEVGVKVLRDDEVILSQEWGPTDGHCLKETGFWRIQNYGNTVISGESILGTLASALLRKFLPNSCHVVK